MFQSACSVVGSSVISIIAAWRERRGFIHCSIGAGMLLNKDGWFVTAGHILEHIEYLEKEVIKSRSRRRGQRDITHYAVAFGAANQVYLGIRGIEKRIDLGFGKLENCNLPDSHMFPRLRKGPVLPGELLCRIGFPFLENHVSPKWVNGGFVFTNMFPLPQFVNEALVSRFIDFKPHPGVWIETSSPGLKGQSGGPLVDAKGLICGIQVNTHSYPLGFGKGQFLHAGRAVHVKSVRAVLDTQNISYQTDGGP